MVRTFTYIWLIFIVIVGKYSIHGSYGYTNPHRLVVTHNDYPSTPSELFFRSSGTWNR